MIKFICAFLFVLLFTTQVLANKPHISVPYNNSAYRYSPYNARQVYVYPVRVYPYFYQDYNVNYNIYQVDDDNYYKSLILYTLQNKKLSKDQEQVLYEILRGRSRY